MSRALLILLAVVYIGAVTWHGLDAKNDVDDAEWTMKAYYLPSAYFGQEVAAQGEFNWETTVPSLYRWYTGGVVRAAGVHAACANAMLPAERASRLLFPQDAHGYVDPEVLDTLRAANIVLYAAMLGILFAVAKEVLGNVWLAAMAVVPIVGSSVFWDSVAWRLGPDALLCLMLVAVLAAWLMLTGRKQLVIVSILAGLASAAKQNGVLVLAAWCGYLAVSGSGAGRVWRPVLAAGLAGAVFSAVNPSTWHGPWEFLRHSISSRMWYAGIVADFYGPHTWWQTTFAKLPTWPLVPLYAWLVWRSRREAWFAPVAWWGAFLALGTFFTIPAPEPRRYLAPIEMGLYFPVALAVIHILKKSAKA